MSEQAMKDKINKENNIIWVTTKRITHSIQIQTYHNQDNFKLCKIIIITSRSKIIIRF